MTRSTSLLRLTRFALPLLALAFAFSANVAPFGLTETAEAAAKAPASSVRHPERRPKPTPVKKETPAPKSEEATKDKPKDKATLEKEFEASLTGASQVEPLTLLREPAHYLNRKVTFTGTFNRFADIALDYKKAFRDSRDYVTFFILRPDVAAGQTIPLSEMKLFFPRKNSAEVMDLESGDKIQIVGTEFSTALDEPWVDVEHIRILQKTDKPERKHTTPEF